MSAKGSTSKSGGKSSNAPPTEKPVTREGADSWKKADPWLASMRSGKEDQTNLHVKNKKYEVSTVTLYDGDYTDIYEGVNVKDREEEVAIKRMNLNFDRDGVAVPTEEKELVLLEEKFLDELRGHPHIIDMLNSEYNKKAGLLTLVLAKGAMFTKLMAKHATKIGNLSANSVLFMMETVPQILSGLDGMHGARIVHLDLKPEIVVVDADGKLRIIDMGSSKRMPEGEILVEATTRSGTLQYLPPELVKENPEVGYACDMWAVGLIICLMLTGELPFAAASAYRSQETVMAEISDPEFAIRIANHVPWLIREVLMRLLDRNPLTRMTLPELRKHATLNPELLMGNPQAAIEDVAEGSQLPLCVRIKRAIDRDSTALLKDLFLNRGAKLDVALENGLFPLHYAAKKNCAMALGTLLALPGADVNQADEAYQTPAHYAAAALSLECLDVLREHRAGWGIEDAEDQIPRDLTTTVYKENRVQFELLTQCFKFFDNLDLAGPAPDPDL